jgi:hypothetical protein
MQRFITLEMKSINSMLQCSLKQTNLTAARVGWSVWGIHRWIESKLASR